MSEAFVQAEIDCYETIVQTSGHTIVEEAIILDRREHFKLCEVYGANWNHKDFNGVTPLMKAAGLNRAFYVERLLALGADKDLCDNKGRKAEDYARLYENYEIQDLLKGI